MGTQYLVRYTLQRIEERVAPSVEKKIKANSLVHIEHIMPQKLSDSWRISLGSEVLFHDEYINRYGNLTMLFWELNIPASNNGFSVKKKFYEKSQVEITQLLLDQGRWGLAQIDERHRWLAELADNVWAVPSLPPGLPASSPGHRALQRFESGLGGLWERVSAYCAEISPEEVQSLAAQLPGHLSDSGDAAAAKQLASRLQKLMEGWEDLDGSERSVVAAAASYFLEMDDETPDGTVGGLEDDEKVVRAAEVALVR